MAAATELRIEAPSLLCLSSLAGTGLEGSRRPASLLDRAPGSSELDRAPDRRS
jgi:hypothetical protein